MKKMLSVKNLSFERNNKVLFQDLNFCMTETSVLQVHGENGSGKSTLLRILAGFIESQSGCVERYSSSLHYLGHQSGAKSNLTVTENLLLNRCMQRHVFTSHELKITLDKVGLSQAANTHVQRLSQGQLRRLGLARLLLSHSQIWILDEPLTALDSQGQTQVLEMVSEHKGVCVVATHHALGLGECITLN